MSKMRDADMPLVERIDAAIERITHGQAAMRVPVEATDPDVVLADYQREIDRLRAELRVIAAANPAQWEADVRDQFQAWAQNRARAALGSE